MASTLCKLYYQLGLSYSRGLYVRKRFSNYISPIQGVVSKLFCSSHQDPIVEQQSNNGSVSEVLKNQKESVIVVQKSSDDVISTVEESHSFWETDIAEETEIEKISKKHYDETPVSSKEIASFLKEYVVMTEGYTNYITTCPRHTLVKLDLCEVDRLYVNKKTGYFVCKSCGRNGVWQQFKDNTLELSQLAQQKKILPESCIANYVHMDIKKNKKIQNILHSAQPVNSVSKEILENLKQAIGIEALTVETLAKFDVQVLSDNNGFVLPLYNGEKKLSGIRVISITVYNVKGHTRKRITSKVLPDVDTAGMFGLNFVSQKDQEVVLTGNEFDAMAVYQQLGLLTFAFPKGTTVLHQALLPSLEQFNKVTVWLGGDQQVWETAVCFTRKLNQDRCCLIRPTDESPNALKAVQDGLPLKTILQKSKSMMHKSIVTLQHLRREVYEEISEANKIAGVKWTRYPVLNTLLKGHRRGELTIFTGPTGAGKTTFISDYSVDLAMQGVNTLWGSFEINNVRLLKTMLMQYSQCNLHKNLNEFDYWADQFEQLPMYFMTFHGQQNVQNVIETMSHAAYVYDIAHIIVDNLQFMMGMESAENRFVKQDQAISAFRRFATTMNCHVTLVVHPRKERDRDEELNVSSIFGSAKASQEADNVLILQDKRMTSLRGKKYVQVAKNRFDGELGIMLLRFNKDTLSFSLSNRASEVKTSSTTEEHHEQRTYNYMNG